MMMMIKHLVTIVIMLATIITITFPMSAPAQGTSLKTYRNADLGYAIDYPSSWEASDEFGTLEIDSSKESLVATLQVVSLADDTSLGEFSDGRVQNVEAVTSNEDMAVYDDTEFGGNDAQGIKYKLNGNTVYVIWTIEDDKAYVLTISIKNSDMESSLLNQANQIKDSFKLMSVNSESSDDDDDDDNNNNDNDNNKDIVFRIDNTIENTDSDTDTDSNTDTDTDSNTDTDTDSNTDTDTDSNTDRGLATITDTDSDTDTDPDTGKDVDCDEGQDFAVTLGVCKDTEQVEDYDSEESISDEIPMMDNANGKESDEEETEAEENQESDDNGNGNGKENGNGKNDNDNGNDNGNGKKNVNDNSNGKKNVNDNDNGKKNEY
jgi:hypothetical protein